MPVVSISCCCSSHCSDSVLGMAGLVSSENVKNKIKVKIKMFVMLLCTLVMYSNSGCSAGMPFACVLAPMVVTGVCGCAIGHCVISKSVYCCVCVWRV